MTSNNSKKLRIGIPRALFYYDYAPLYETFFKEIDCEVIVSDSTSKKILADGLSASNNELCLPIKLLYGHILNLKDRVDYIFLPYIISTQQGSYICPKLIGAPDIIKANLEVNLLSVDIDMNNTYNSFLSALKEVAFKIDANPMKIYNAYTKAVNAQKKFDTLIMKGASFEDAMRGVQTQYQFTKTLAVIGHSYTFNDEYASSGLLQKLKANKIRVLTSDMLSHEEVKQILHKIKKKTHWNLGNRILAAGIKFSSMPQVDGIIYITPFSCSSDSLVKEYMEAHFNQKPFMTITVDEHSGDVGFITRLEAFVDMIDRKKNRPKMNQQSNATLVKKLLRKKK